MIRRKERMPTGHIRKFSPGLCGLLSRAFRHERSMGQHQQTSRRAGGALVGARQEIWEGQLGYNHCHPPVPAARLGPLADTFRLCQASLPLLLDHAQPSTSRIWNPEFCVTGCADVSHKRQQTCTIRLHFPRWGSPAWLYARDLQGIHMRQQVPLKLNRDLGLTAGIQKPKQPRRSPNHRYDLHNNV